MIKKGAIIFALFFLSTISCISAAVTFPASNVSIKIDSTDRTAQYAADNGLLKGIQTYASATLTAIGQHDASKIWVSVQDGEMTLIQALQSTNKLCPKSTKPLTYSNSAPNPGHYGTEVIFSSGKSLQQVINDGTLCTTYSWITSKWSPDNACPTTTFTRTVYCKRDDGTNMGTICGTYSGCSCPTPATSTTTTCTWGSKKYIQCGCMNLWAGSTPLCTGMQDCSKEGKSCNSRSSSEYCAGGTCSCGSACSSDSVYTLTCSVNSP